ncbi:MAG: ABC transporter ATP-binding protein, partial [Elusimicrobia bacterium]|nr:ABC transporter ATP-binding protein [Elusimicrobiota bacterium]
HLLRLPAEAWGSAAPEKMAPRLLNNLDYLSPKDIILPLYMPYYAAMFLISAGLFLYADWHMALLALAGVPLSLLVALSYGDVYQSTNDSYTTRSAGMVTSADKYLHRFEDIQLNGMEEAARALFDRQAEDLAQVGILRAYAYGGYQAAGGVLSDFFTRLPIAALQIWSLFWRGKPTMGTIGATQGLIGNMREAVDGIAQAIMRAQEADGALEIIGRLARAKPRIEPWDALPLGPMQGAISVRGVGFSYSPEGPPALNDVSLEILPGQSVALAGRNGSGKSTLLRLIAGTLRPASGEVLIDGVPLEKIERAGFLKQISFLSQKPALFPGTARHNLLLAAPRSTAEQIEEALRQADAEFLLRRPEGLDVDVSHLSGGELQRLLLARALLRRPKLLLLDEAASALDPVTKRGVEEALERGRLERTTIQVSHDPAALKRADRIVVLDEGRIVETGSYDELMARRGAFYKLAHAAAAKSRRRR